MAIIDPKTHTELLAISGVGEQKIARYGDAFLARLAEVRALASGESLPYTEPVPEKKKVDTVDATFKLLTKGLNRAQIAEQRGLSIDTIGSHLLKLYQAKKITLAHSLYLTTDEVEEVMLMCQKLGIVPKQTATKALHAALGGRFGYSDLNMVLWMSGETDMVDWPIKKASKDAFFITIT